MRCYHKILRASYNDHVTNAEICAKIQQAICPHEDLRTIVKRSKLKWYEHVSRTKGLAQNILQDTEKGGRRHVRQKKRWENTREWTGLEIAVSEGSGEQRKMEETGCEAICGARIRDR